MIKASTLNRAFYKDKRVFVTGHTGFKGAWLSQVLHSLGAVARGYALAPEDSCLFEKIGGVSLIDHVIGDVRDKDSLLNAINDFKPEIILHLAAVVTVQDCYNDPYRAFSTNIMGTVNIFEAARECQSIKSVVALTTDKVYENKGDSAVYKVGDALTGADPVSASNTSAEYVFQAYKNSYLQKPERSVGIATARPSNVIAGGDHVSTRLIPSILGGFADGKPVELRNPDQTRSWQSVLDALNGYLSIGRKLYEDPVKYSHPWNIGPTKDGIQSVGYIYEVIRKYFDSDSVYTVTEQPDVKESKTLGLDIGESVALLDWFPEQSLDKIIYDLTDFYKRQRRGEADCEICTRQVNEFFRI